MPPTKVSISRESLIEHALELADCEGLDAVTIRRLAQEFSVTPMALYWHVKSKDELLAAMGDALFDGLVLPAPAGTWVDGLRGVMEALVKALRAHPASADLAYLRVLQCDSGRELTECALGLLRGAGFTVHQSADVARNALHTAVMLVNGEPGAERSVPADQRDQILLGKKAAIAALPKSRYPNLVACADALTSCDDVPSYYSAGVELFVGGVAGLARRD